MALSRGPVVPLPSAPLVTKSLVTNRGAEAAASSRLPLARRRLLPPGADRDSGLLRRQLKWLVAIRLVVVIEPGPALFRHFIEQVSGLTGSVYGRRMYEVMRYWDEDHPEWTPSYATSRRRGGANRSGSYHDR